jgi:hypothetical protein
MTSGVTGRVQHHCGKEARGAEAAALAHNANDTTCHPAHAGVLRLRHSARGPRSRSSAGVRVRGSKT